MLAPQVIRRYSNRGAPIKARGIFPVVLLTESLDGASLNEEGVLNYIGGSDAIAQKLGRDLFSNWTNDVLKMFFKIAKVGILHGRITGAGGVKGQTAVINDFAGTPAATIRFRWRGKSGESNRYEIRVARGALSTADTGAGRVDTRVSLVETATSNVVFFLDRLVMDTTSQNYLVAKWNAAGVQCEALDQTPADTYQNTDEPAVGTYVFTAGADPAAATSTERIAAVAALAGNANAYGALVGVVAWDAAAVNALAAAGDANFWGVIPHMDIGTTPSSAATFTAAITSQRRRVGVHVGWGKSQEAPFKDIPAIGQVLAQAVLGAQSDGSGRSYNTTGANEDLDVWAELPPVSLADRNAYAVARVNPVYPVTNEYQNGAVVGDVLSLDAIGERYSQWGMGRGEDLVVMDILAWLEARVKNRKEYVWQAKKADGSNTNLTNASLTRVDVEIAKLMTTKYPGTLFDRARGVGWNWAGDVVTDTNGTNPIFWLGLDVAGVGRIIYLEIGQVAGRFGVTAVGGGA